jgi:hypothetical protein
MRLIVPLIAVLLLGGLLAAEEDPSPALQALAGEVAEIRKHADAALKTKNAEEQQKAYQEIDALVAKFEAWEEAAHKAGWGDDKVESEQKKAGWDALLDQAKKLKAAGAATK